MFKPRGRAIHNQSFNLPAPVGGLDAVSSLMQMPEKNAVALENWFPRPDGLVTRPGYSSHLTGLSGTKRLHVYSAPSGTESLWATTDAGVYNATTAGAVGSAAIALTNGATISTAISTGAGNYLMLVNGVDTLKQYDGATWSSVATLGATATSDYSFVALYRQRIFFIKKNSLEIEYLAPNSISGTPTNYPLGAVFSQGGYLVAMSTWTIDAGLGPEDHMVLVSSKGEAAIYVGNDPAVWAKKGVYMVGQPLGALCCMPYGGDLLILTEAGVIPLSTAVQSTSIDRSRAFTQTIRPIFNRLAALFADSLGWQIIVDPLTPMVLVNTPSTPVVKQYVMHSQTGAWTTYSGLEATAWARMGSTLYFATASGVNVAGGFSDNGSSIVATVAQAYNRWRYPANKQLKLARPYLSATGRFAYILGVSSNFIDPREYTNLSNGIAPNVALWGTAHWGEDYWTGSIETTQDWQTVPDDFTLWKSLYLQVQTNNSQVTFLGTDILFTPGGNF